MNRGSYMLLGIILFMPFFLFSQEGGRVTGKVLEESSNSPLAGVSVQVVGGTGATSTDFEGDYTLGLGPGTYTLRFSWVGYDVKEFSEESVESGWAIEIDMGLSPAAEELADVVVSVAARRIAVI